MLKIRHVRLLTAMLLIMPSIVFGQVNIRVDTASFWTVEPTSFNVSYRTYNSEVANASNSAQYVGDLSQPEHVIHHLRIADKPESHRALFEDAASFKPQQSSHYAALAASGDEDIYFKLLLRLDYQINGLNYSIIKYSIVDIVSGVSFMAARRLKNIDGRWVIATDEDLFRLDEVVFEFSTEFMINALQATDFSDWWSSQRLPDIGYVPEQLDFAALRKLLDLCEEQDRVNDPSSCQFLNDIVTRL